MMARPMKTHFALSDDPVLNNINVQNRYTWNKPTVNWKLVIINHRPHGFDVQVKKYTVTYDLRAIYMEVGEP